MISRLFTPVLALGLACAGAFAAERSRPNVILIYSDDHGFADVAAQGTDPDVRTPHLDALARDGVRFARGYVSAPQCVPSRAGVLTGRYQQRFGVEDNTRGPLPLAEVTIAERLKPAGYVSAQVGKWHLEPIGRAGNAEEAAPAAEAGAFLPGAQGFDEYYCGPMNTFLASHDLTGRPLAAAPRRLTDARFRCLWQTDAAVSFVERHAQQPFFLYLAYFTPHVPLESPEPWFSRTPAHLPLARRQALAMIAAMDEGIGRLRQRLRDLGLEQNTLVFFIGDNGAPLKDGAWNGSLNTPLTGEKGMLTDGGIRTPFLAAWPGTLPAGRVYAAPVSSLDVAATAAAVAGLPADPALDGVNLLPFVRGENPATPHPALFWRWRSQAAILADRWKLILLGPSEKFLFDLTSPEAESRNRLGDFPAIAADLERQLLAWDATMPAPHLPRAASRPDEAFFQAHVLHTAPAPALGAVPTTKGRASTTKAGNAAVQGWVGRGAMLTVEDGALRVAGERGAGGFITHNGLSLTGPLEVTLRVRSPAGGPLTVAWRTAEEPDFVAAHVARTTLPASPEWQDIHLTVPAAGRVIHIRVHPPLSEALALAKLTLTGSAAREARAWDFASAPAP